MLLSLSSSQEALGLRGVFAVRDEPSRITPGECGVMLEPAFEFGDPGRPAAEGVGDRLVRVPWQEAGPTDQRQGTWPVTRLGSGPALRRGPSHHVSHNPLASCRR